MSTTTKGTMIAVIRCGALLVVACLSSCRESVPQQAEPQLSAPKRGSEDPRIQALGLTDNSKFEEPFELLLKALRADDEARKAPPERKL